MNVSTISSGVAPYMNPTVRVTGARVTVAEPAARRARSPGRVLRAICPRGSRRRVLPESPALAACRQLRLFVDIIPFKISVALVRPCHSVPDHLKGDVHAAEVHIADHAVGIFLAETPEEDSDVFAKK